MAPLFAGTLTCAFIVAAFAIDSRGERQVSYAIWVPFLWIGVAASRSFSQWLGISPASAEGYLEANLRGSAVDQAFMLTLIALAAIILIGRQSAWTRVARMHKSIVVFLLFMGLTVLWSDIPAVSLRRWVRLLAGVLMVVVIMTERDPAAAVSLVLRRTAYVFIPLSVLFVKYFPELGVLYSWAGQKVIAGVALEKNNLGHLCAVSALFLFWNVISMKREGRAWGRAGMVLDLTVLGMALWILYRSDSSTSFGALLVGAATCVALRFHAARSSLRHLLVVSVTVVGALLALELAVDLSSMIVRLLGRDTSFTGRTPLWSVLFDLGGERALLGYGYGGFWWGPRLEEIWDRTGLPFLIAHNGYLEVFLEGGVVGFALLLWMLISVVQVNQQVLAQQWRYGSLTLSLLVIVLLCNVTESSFARPQSFLWFVFLLVSMPVSVHHLQSHRTRAGRRRAAAFAGR